MKGTFQFVFVAFLALAAAKPPAYSTAPAYPSEQQAAYSKSENTYPKPEPAYPKPGPAYPKPEPVYPKPEPAYPKPEPAYPKPEPPQPKPEIQPHKSKPMPFQYEWAVKDEASENDYSHKAVSDGTVENGIYRVVLPDGRTQIVTYKADENGYVADVQYLP